MFSATGDAASRLNINYPWGHSQDAVSCNIAGSAAASSATELDIESSMSTPTAAAEGMDPPPSLSTTVDVGPDTNPRGKERQVTLWSKVVKGTDCETLISLLCI